MMSQSVCAAVEELQRQALLSSDSFENDRIDLALNEILRHPESTALTHALVYSSRGHALERLTGRRRLLGGTLVSLVEAASEDAEYDEQVARALATADSGYVRTDWERWISTSPSLTDGDRIHLQALAGGEDAASLATALNVSVSIMRQRISRSRRRGRDALEQEIQAA